jgi:hypothetical protein
MGPLMHMTGTDPADKHRLRNPSNHSSDRKSCQEIRGDSSADHLMRATALANQSPLAAHLIPPLAVMSFKPTPPGYGARRSPWTRSSPRMIRYDPEYYILFSSH